MKVKKETNIFIDFFKIIALISISLVVAFVLYITINNFSHIAMVNHHTTMFLGRLF